MTIQLSLNFDLNWDDTPKTSTRDCWETPPHILEIVRSAFADCAIVTDPCTTKDNSTKAQKYFTPKENGLTQIWEGNAFINPPYSNPSPWIDEVSDRVAFGEIEEAIALLPTGCLGSERSGLPAKQARALCLWRGRIAFVHPKTGRPAKQTSFTSAFLYWGRSSQQFKEVFSQYGIVAIIN